MKITRNTLGPLVVCAVGLGCGTLTLAQQAASPSAAALPDGQHDFDFELGNWKAHVRRLAHRLSGAHDWEEFNGTVVTRPLMDGKGNLTEINADEVLSHRHLQGIAVRLYDPTSRQWRIYGADPDTGVFDPPQIGKFDGPHGEFYATDLYQGRAIYIRYVWQKVSASVTHFEQAFSADGGKTWEVNWIYDGTRQ